MAAILNPGDPATVSVTIRSSLMGLGEYYFVEADGMLQIAPASAITPVPDGGAQPRVTDDDAGEITVSLDGRELRGWSYANDAERRQKMLLAREYVEGWCDARRVMEPA